MRNHHKFKNINSNCWKNIREYSKQSKYNKCLSRIKKENLNIIFKNMVLKNEINGYDIVEFYTYYNAFKTKFPIRSQLGFYHNTSLSEGHHSTTHIIQSTEIQNLKIQKKINDQIHYIFHSIFHFNV